MAVGSLFSGIGGFDLGFERTRRFETRWFCEKDAYCQRVLAKHWPGVPCYPDIEVLKGSGLNVDVLVGGFPCQDISYAGKGAGIAGARSGLWSHYARLIGELEPRYVVAENVPAIRSRGLEVVLQDLASLGYDSEWGHLSAAAFGAPHTRDRWWLVAYPNSSRRASDVRGGHEEEHTQPGGYSTFVPHAAGSGSQGTGGSSIGSAVSGGGDWGQHWVIEPDVGRVADGVPARVDRLRALGNALLPQIAEFLALRILSFEGYSSGTGESG